MGLVGGTIILPPARKLAGGIVQVFSALPEDLIGAVPDEEHYTGVCYGSNCSRMESSTLLTLISSFAEGHAPRWVLRKGKDFIR